MRLVSHEYRLGFHVSSVQHHPTSSMSPYLHPARLDVFTRAHDVRAILSEYTETTLKCQTIARDHRGLWSLMRWNTHLSIGGRWNTTHTHTNECNTYSVYILPWHTPNKSTQSIGSLQLERPINAGVRTERIQSIASLLLDTYWFLIHQSSLPFILSSSSLHHYSTSS